MSEVVLDEVERTLNDDFSHLDPSALRRRVGHMRVALADQTIDTAMAGMVPDAINAKDRHVVAAALIAEASVVVTYDSSLRSELAAADLDVEPVDGDTFVMRLWEESPSDVSGVIEALVEKRQRPVTATATIEQLRVHFPSMAAAWSGPAR